MTIEIVPHSPEYSARVDEFNRRMHQGGSRWGFYVDPVPDWIPERDGRPVWREYHLAVEDRAEVRGAYALKPQAWWIRGEVACVTDWQGPFTEGAVNARYSTLGLRLLRDMLRKHPLLYSLGHGSDGKPMLALLRSLGWTIHETPFCFRVARPYRFLRGNRLLRKKRWQALLLDVAAWSGAGALGLSVAQHLKAVGSRRTTAAATVVDAFGTWADDLWQRCKDDYLCLAVRDRNMMNTLLPATGWPGGIRLMVQRDGQTIGWSVVLIKDMHDDARFGNLRVALIADCFGAPGDARDVLAATHQYAETAGVDLVCANLCHPAWVGGVRSLGYWIVENRREFAISPDLRQRLEPFEETTQGLHLTNLDGHGPHGFTS